MAKLSEVGGLFSEEELAVEVHVVDVALALPIHGVFTYKIDDDLLDKAQEGMRVLVPFRNREMVGYVVKIRTEKTTSRLKTVKEVLDEKPVLSPLILKLTEWVGIRYGSSWGEAIENALPKWVKYGKKAERALAKEKKEEVDPDLKPTNEFKLTAEQQTAFDLIQESLNEEKTKPILLHGVTGSGKSEVYIRSIRETLSKGKSAICLVPEIALTEQIKRFFYQHFADQLEILHSKLSDTERFLAWKRIEDGRKRVILGPRSAVFAPVPNLGLLIMDEEHEGSYKQETVPRYHAREVAEWRAFHEKALFVMGTATPSLETMFKARSGNIHYVHLEHRIDDRPMPEVRVVDLKDERAHQRKSVIIGRNLANEIEANLSSGEGTLLLLNRRGYSTHIHCSQCGSIEECDSCQVSLTFHQEDDSLLCHYCNLSKKVSDVCSACGEKLLRFAGFGTEKVESEVARRWPNARIMRMDADSVRKKGSHESILKAFRERKVDILIGTQMIAKGFDFPHVTLVGVVFADVGLALPDFRSAERTFQLLAQVAGRAGRGDQVGRVVIQTFSPDHPSVRFAKKHDFLSFYEDEIVARKRYQYPPFAQLLNFIIRSRDENKAYLFAREIRDVLKQNPNFQKKLQNKELEIIGPAPLPFYKLRGHFRWHLMFKCFLRDESPKEDWSELWDILDSIKKPSSVAMAIDVEPVNIL